MIQHPLVVLLLVCRIDNDQVFFPGFPVNNQIIHRASVFVAHRAVLGLAVLDLRIIIGEKHLKICLRIFSRAENLSHMGNIKEPCPGAHRHVFLDHSCRILHRKRITCKRNHLSSGLYMFFIKWCF